MTDGCMLHTLHSHKNCMPFLSAWTETQPARCWANQAAIGLYRQATNACVAQRTLDRQNGGPFCASLCYHMLGEGVVHSASTNTTFVLLYYTAKWVRPLSVGVAAITLHTRVVTITTHVCDFFCQTLLAEDRWPRVHARRISEFVILCQTVAFCVWTSTLA